MTHVTPPLHDAHVENFRTLMQAAEDDALCLASCLDKATGEPRAVVCATYIEDGEAVLVPIAKLFDGNPYDELVPPSVEDEE